MDTPERKSEYAKRVLFGAPKQPVVAAAVTTAGSAAAAAAAADKQATSGGGGTGGSSSRSGSQGSTASAPGGAIYSAVPPGTPSRTTTNGESWESCSLPNGAGASDGWGFISTSSCTD